MVQKADTKFIKYIGKVVLITLLVIFIIRCFFFESFTISTSQMESSLIKGDEVIVSKLSYGPRLPITLISMPFAFDKLYSDLVELPYIRLFSSEILRNDVVLFNSPLELDKPLDKRSIMISRCVAVPGDTIFISNGVYYINGKEYIHSPMLIDEYFTLSDNFGEINTLSEKLSLDMELYFRSADTVYFTMSRYDAYILNNNMGSGLFYRKDYVIPKDLIFIVPSDSRKVELTENNIKIYRQIIELEYKDRAHFEGNKVYIDGKSIDTYTFHDDYYWMLSDNTILGLDSRELGFVPFKNTIGRATSILYSYGQGFRPNRFFAPVR